LDIGEPGEATVPSVGWTEGIIVTHALSLER